MFDSSEKWLEEGGQLLRLAGPLIVNNLSIAGMQPVGQYAYSIEFSDGHSSGIYTLEYLRELG